MTLEEVRQRFAEELRRRVMARSEGLVRAFAAVPREHYLGPAPWQIRNLPQEPEEADDPAALYANVLVAIDPSRQLNNGEPALHMHLMDALDLQAGEDVVHIGTGTGYYTAILAEVVGPRGRVTGIEIDPDLAARARDNLSHLDHVRVIAGNGAEADFDPADCIYVNAGASHVPALWLEKLRPEGRLLVPLTGSDWIGGTLLVTRGADPGASHPARIVSPIGVFPCQEMRDPDRETRLRDAFKRGYPPPVHCLRRDRHAPEPECWLHADDVCLSSRQAC
jgi:protein-L-isoaspartate(D-aspartate) O-methyltransferase